MARKNEKHVEEFVCVQMNSQGHPLAHFRFWTQTLGDIDTFCRFRTNEMAREDPRDGSFWFCGSQGRAYVTFEDRGVELPTVARTFETLSDLFDAMGYDPMSNEFSGKNTMLGENYERKGRGL